MKKLKAIEIAALVFAALVFAAAVLLPFAAFTVQFWTSLEKSERDLDLVTAAARGDTTRITALLDQGAKVNATGFEGTSGLWWAAYSRYPDAVRVLLLHGANPDNPSQFGQSPLEGAVENLNNDTGTTRAKTDMAVIRLLLSKGASVTKVKRDASSVALLKTYGLKI